MFPEIFLEKDLPIQSKDEDLLGRSYFASQLASTIIGYTQLPNNQDGIVIGIEGPWGSGKTSLLNMIKENLDQNRITIGSVNAWMSTDKFSLTKEFINVLLHAFGNGIGKLPVQIKGYVKSILDATAHAVTINAGISNTSISINSGAFLDNLQSEKTILSRKEEVIQLAQQSKKWTVICIDDIDRLNDQEIGVLFQLIKNIADFPKVIYLLAYDRDIVSTALNHIQEKHGEDFIEKVVQVTYSVPVPDKERLNRYLFYKFNTVIEGREAYRIDQGHINALFNSGLSDYITSIRDCNRIFNAFSMKYALCGNECDIGDLLAVTILELFEPKVFSLLPSLKFPLIGTSVYGLGNADIEIVKASVQKLTNNDIANYPDTLKTLLPVMFPETHVASGGPTIINDENYLRNKISDIECFDHYFELMLKPSEVPFSEIINFLRLDRESEISAKLNEWNNKDKLHYALDQIRRLLLESSQNKIHLMISNSFVIHLLHCFSNMHIHESSHSFRFSPNLLAEFIVELLVDLHIDNSKISPFDFFKSIISDSQISLFFIQRILIHYSAGHDWLMSSEIKNKQPKVSEAVFKNMDRFYLNHIHDMANNGTLEKERRIQFTLLIWEKENPTSFKEYISSSYTIEKVAFLLNNLVSIGYASGTPSHRIYVLSKESPLYQELSPIYDTAAKLLNKDSISKLDEEDQYIYGAFMLLYEKQNSRKLTPHVPSVDITDEMIKEYLEKL